MSMYVLILFIHILVAVVLMAVVLMQSGKGGGLSGAFGGGGGNQTLFGGRGAVDFLGKATWVLGGLFMVTSLTLAVMAGNLRETRRGRIIEPARPAAAPAFPVGEDARPVETAPLPMPEPVADPEEAGETAP